MPWIKKIRAFFYKSIQLLRIDDVISNSPFLLRNFHSLIPGPNFYSPETIKTIKRNGSWFKVYPYDLVQWILLKRPNEPYGIRELELELKDFTSKICVLDIGANIGQFSLMAASLLNQKKGMNNFYIHSFEPVSKSRTAFEFNLELNPWFENNINIYPFGLGDKIDQFQIEIPLRNTGAASIRGEFSKNMECYFETIDIKCLDEIILSLKIEQVKFIKIDVEGFEPKVIKGATQLLKRDKPALFFEINPQFFNRNRSAYLDSISFLETLNYQLYIIDSNKKQSYSRNRLFERSKQKKEFSIYASTIMDK